mgnify:CR=1 FL=1
MNSIGGDVLDGLNKAIDMAEKDYQGLVVANDGKNFSVGANIGMIFMMAVEQEYEELNMAIKYFQDTMMRLRYCNVPVIVAPHNLALGVIAGVALAGILFSRKVAKVIKVKSIEVNESEIRYEVVGQLFFVSKIYFLQGFEYHEHPIKVTIDMSKAHVWDQSGVAALDQVIRKLSLGGSSVEVVGLNEESLDLFERMGNVEMSVNI